MSRNKDIVKGKNAHFVYFRDRLLFNETDDGFQFPIPIDDAGSATFNAEEKAILLMRHIGSTSPGLRRLVKSRMALGIDNDERTAHR